MIPSPYILRHFEKRQGETENFLHFFLYTFPCFDVFTFPGFRSRIQQKNKATKTAFHIYIVAD